LRRSNYKKTGVIGGVGNGTYIVSEMSGSWRPKAQKIEGRDTV